MLGLRLLNRRHLLFCFFPPGLYELPGFLLAGRYGLPGLFPMRGDQAQGLRTLIGLRLLHGSQGRHKGLVSDVTCWIEHSTYLAGDIFLDTHFP